MSDLEPVKLVEDETTGDRFLVYGSDSGLQLDIRYEGETLWMTQPQIAQLFGVTRQGVNAHVNNIYDEGELDRDSTCKEILQVREEAGRTVNRRSFIHNLDVVIAVGYRVSTKQGTLFRRWATDKLVQFASKGFVIDAPRLKNPENRDRVAELRDIIRDIRSDEANVYRELRSICAMCQDYDGQSEGWHEFYKQTQAKLIYAVCTHTPAEVLRVRADAKEPNMGLQTWTNDNVRKSDVTTSKNYLAPAEIKELNRLTTILLDIFEDQMDVGRLKLMSEASTLLDGQLSSLGRSVLRTGGRVSMVDAKRHAEREYGKWKDKQKSLRHAEADRSIAEIKQAQKALPKGRKSKS
ncbi:MAG: RhuM family protein [Pseudomonadota bacterium]